MRDEILPRTVHSVTFALRDVMPDEDDEVLESVAMLAAADDSLRILSTLAAGGETIRPLRVVIAADVDSSQVGEVSEGKDVLPTAKSLLCPVTWDSVDSILVDDTDLLDEILLAIDGNDDAFERVADEDLMWFDVDERNDLIAYFS